MAIISDQSIPWRTRDIIVLNAKFDTYPMRKTLPAQENTGLVADDLSIDYEGAKYIQSPDFNR